jgi:outer membrane lipoprotein-sorting protein
MNYLKAFLLTSAIVLNACGSEPQIIYVYPQDMQQGGMQQQPMAQQPMMQQDAYNPDQMPSLSNPSQAVVPKQAGTTKAPVATGKAPVSNVKSPVVPGKAPAPTAAAGASTEEKLLKKARDSFAAVTGVSASIKTYENNGTEGTGVIKFLYKKPGSIKVEVISSSSSGQTGVKLAYSDPNNVKVRPSGMLSMVSVSLAMNDSKLLSGRKYQLNQIDLPTTVNRLTQPGEKAKLIGQSTVGGAPVYVIEVSGQSFDPKITREIFSIDAKTFMPRMHEMYEGGKKVYAAEISSITVNPPLTANDFEV